MTQEQNTAMNREGFAIIIYSWTIVISALAEEEIDYRKVLQT